MFIRYVDFMNVFTFNYRFPVEAEMSRRAALYSGVEKSRFDFGAQLNVVSKTNKTLIFYQLATHKFYYFSCYKSENGINPDI